MTDAIYYGLLGGLITLSCVLLLLAVDIITRGPDRRRIARMRKRVRKVDVPAKLPRLRVVPKRAEEDRWS
jgi:hypothetical protein